MSYILWSVFKKTKNIENQVDTKVIKKTILFTKM